MSGFVAHDLSGYMGSQEVTHHEPNGMVTGDSEDEIYRSVFGLAGKAVTPRRSGAVVGVCARSFPRYLDRYEEAGLRD